MRKKIYIATHNVGKQKEFATFFANEEVEFIFPSGQEAPEETASTFVENALIKAREGCRVSGLPTLADDTGLVVPALQGAPGIYSARYAGLPVDQPKNIQKLLKEMEMVSDRRAYFYCVLVLLEHAEDPAPLIAEAYWQGELLKVPQGEGGFGYDAIFFSPEEKKSVAELDPLTKNKLSHRGKALRALQEKMRYFVKVT